MVNILIDGYNLIGTAHKNLEMARGDLIEKLGRYARMKGHSVTVVFDGWKDGQPATTRQRIGSVTVMYSGLGEKADALITSLLSSSSKAWVVVSSDREIYTYAEKRHYAALTAEEFETKLFSVLGSGDQPDTEESPGGHEAFLWRTKGKKGNPRKLSKRDRRRIDALKRL